MITLIPLKQFLETNELEVGTTLVARKDKNGPFHVGKFQYERRNIYSLEMENGTEGIYAERFLGVPISVQKFFVLPSDSPDIKTL